MVVKKFQEKEEKFAEYLETIQDDYLTKDSVDISFEHQMLKLSYN